MSIPVATIIVGVTEVVKILSRVRAASEADKKKIQAARLRLGALMREVEAEAEALNEEARDMLADLEKEELP